MIRNTMFGLSLLALTAGSAFAAPAKHVATVAEAAPAGDTAAPADKTAAPVKKEKKAKKEKAPAKAEDTKAEKPAETK